MTFAPVPEFARGPDIPDAGYLVTDLGGGAYGITSGLVNTMFLVTKQGVVVVDAPPDLGGKLLTGIAEVTPKPVTHLIYSHAHADHIGSARLLGTRRPDNRRPRADRTVRQGSPRRQPACAQPDLQRDQE